MTVITPMGQGEVVNAWDDHLSANGFVAVEVVKMGRRSGTHVDHPLETHIEVVWFKTKCLVHF